MKQLESIKDAVTTRSTAGLNFELILLVCILGAILFSASSEWVNNPQDSETMMAMAVLFAIAFLVALLTIAVSAFSKLELSDSRQALGLPEGSVRALIAFFLIIIFIIMSVYMFRTIADGRQFKVENLMADQVTQFEGRVVDIEQNDSKEGELETFNVVLRVDVPPAAEQLALQLVTILGTLVTAVSAFYFGSATASKRQASDPEIPPSSLANGGSVPDTPQDEVPVLNPSMP